MLARIAQELFWLGRDLTRAEHTARMLDGAFHADVAGARAGERGVGIALSWNGVLAVIGAKPPAPGEEAAEGAAAEAAALRAARRCWAAHEIAPLLTLDTDSPASVVSCVYRARERARTLRDVISTEMWEALNSFYLSLGRYDLRGGAGDRAVLGLPGGQGALRAVLGAAGQDDAARRGAFVPGRRRPHRGGRHGPADAARRDSRRRDGGRDSTSRRRTTRPRRSRCCRRSAASRRSGGTCARGRRCTASAASCSTRAQYPGSVLASLEELRDALETADPMPRSAPPVLRLGRLIADLELQQRTRSTVRSRLSSMLARVQAELELIDREIDERYFAVAPHVRCRPFWRVHLMIDAASRDRHSRAQQMHFAIRYLTRYDTTRTSSTTSTRCASVPPTDSRQRVDDFTVRLTPGRTPAPARGLLRHRGRRVRGRAPPPRAGDRRRART